MKLGFDIFRRLDDGDPLWLDQADSLDAARKKLASLREFAPGNYFVRDAETGQTITDENSGESERV